MAGVSLHFSSTLTPSDPRTHPVLIIGQVKNLERICFNDIKMKLDPQVSQEDFAMAITSLNPSSMEPIPLYMNLAQIAALPSKCSRHNSPSRGYAISKIIKNASHAMDQSVVLVSEYKDIFASSCAVSRAFPLYSRKTSPSVTSYTVSIEFLLIGSSELERSLTEEDLQLLTDAARGIRLAACIVDTPCNEMNVDNLLKEIENVGLLLNIKPLIIQGTELEKRGFGGLWCVGKAAENLPALAVLSHTPTGAQQTIAWVGKGIVFDTGGLSIKAKTSMVGMKRDCGGAAAILGAFFVAVKQGFKDNLHAVFCLAENSVGPNATRPDDITTLYSGRTVEINNTDAEGRLVVGDGVAYAHRDLQANIILDMCTLTGAQGIATGKFHAALVTNCEEWEVACVHAGQISGELVHPMPYCPELHFCEFASTLADMKNSVADRSNAQLSCAGLFIAAQIGFDFPGSWIHLDIASLVHSGERATGYGVALLLTLFGHLSNNTLLQSISPKVQDNGVMAENVVKKMRLV